MHTTAQCTHIKFVCPVPSSLLRGLAIIIHLISLSLCSEVPNTLLGKPLSKRLFPRTWRKNIICIMWRFDLSTNSGREKIIFENQNLKTWRGLPPPPSSHHRPPAIYPDETSSILSFLGTVPLPPSRQQICQHVRLDWDIFPTMKEQEMIENRFSLWWRWVAEWNWCRSPIRWVALYSLWMSHSWSS